MNTATTGIRSFNSGHMPLTDFCYEEFEGLLASFFLTAIPLRDCGSASYLARFNEIHNILNGFAERYNVQKPEDAIVNPRKTEEEWGQAKAFCSTCQALDMTRSFWCDFGVGTNSASADAAALRRLQRLFEDL